MRIKQVVLFTAVMIFTGMATASHASDNDSASGEMQHHHMMHEVNDGRVSLGLSTQMKQHQLTNMRSHLEAVRDIIGLIAEQEFDEASGIAHSKLGLTEEMQQMCSMFNNAEFMKLGMAFHQSGDVLGDVLKTKDTNKSLRALQNTLGYCVECHAAFRQ